jgi:hypothetical protein
MITVLVRCCPLYARDTASTSVSTTNGYLHARPNDSSAVEGFFAKLTKRRLKRGVFHSIVDLQAAGLDFSVSVMF